MPQEIRVVKCYKCQVFQTDIVKKAKKWQCKLCNEKQSVLKEFARGTGKECRLHAQKLNENRENINKAKVDLSMLIVNNLNENNFEINNSMNENILQMNEMKNENKKKENKWLKFVESDKEERNNDGLIHFSVFESKASSSAGTNICNSSRLLGNKRLLEDLNGRPSKIYKFLNNEKREDDIEEFKRVPKKTSETTVTSDSLSDQISTAKNIKQSGKILHNTSLKNSKWAKYLPDNDDDEGKEEDENQL